MIDPMFLHTWHPQPLVATIGTLELHWYGVLLAIASISAIGLLIRQGKRYGFDSNALFDAALIIIIVGFIGGRLYHVLNEWSYYRTHLTDIWRVWNGGLALHGGLIAGGIAVFFVARRQQWSAWLLADVAAPAVALGQMIGRWGNYFNQELFGRPTNLPWGIPIDQRYRPAQYFGQEFFHPTFLYESLGLLLILGGLLFLHRRYGKQLRTGHFPAGVISLAYLGSYALLRVLTELLRLDRTPVIGGLRLPILVSGVLLISSIVVLLIRLRRAHAARS